MRTPKSAWLGTARAIAAFALATFCAAAGAAPVPETDLQQGSAQFRPWAQGISAGQQQQAAVLFHEANGLLHESLFLPAATKYREALKIWNHPAIHYNIALALLGLDQPVQLHEHLLQAVEYGPAPLGSDKFEYAKTYLTLVEKQLAHLQILCNEPAAEVTMDGKPLFTAPGKFDGWVRAGPHSIVANKAGYSPTDVSRPLPGGEVTRISLSLFTADQLTHYRTRWDVWKPWAVLGSGAVVALAGGYLQLKARDDYRAFDSRIQACQGCFPDSSVRALKTRGDALQRVAVGGYVLGGAGLALGALGLFLNQPVAYHVDPAKSAGLVMSFAPIATKETTGAMIIATF